MLPEGDVAYALTVIRQLSEKIGGRGSCTPAVQEAAEYIASQLSDSGVPSVKLEPFSGVPSTYRPFVLVFSLCFFSTVAALIWGGNPLVLWIAAAANALGLIGMLAESNLSPSWMHWLLPKIQTQNVVGILHPRKTVNKRLILCAHRDSHRTPIFYSSPGWQKAFSFLVAAALISMAIALLGFGAAAMGIPWLKWGGILAAPIQLFALVMVASADFTPFSPGANDNASGVGVVLSLAKRLAEQPLEYTETYFVFTDCEEVGSYGMRAYLKKHAGEFTSETVVIVPDEVGNEQIKFLSADGLVIKHRTHPGALELIRRAQKELPEVPSVEMVGLAYTDALPATKLGLAAITICSIAKEGQAAGSHWHQMSDTVEFISSTGLENAIKFIDHIIQQVDQPTG